MHSLTKFVSTFLPDGLRYLSDLWVRTCSFSSQKFLIIHLPKPDSVNSSHSFSIRPCSLAGEEFRSFVGVEVFWFRAFSSFFVLVSSHLCGFIYLSSL